MKMKLTGTFIQPICGGDTPVMNWSRAEWDREFAVMKELGIDTVILLRLFLDDWMAYDSPCLRRLENAIPTQLDYVDLFLSLAEKHGIRLFVPTYSPMHDWLLATYDPKKEFAAFKELVDEIWSRYGNRKAFGGWYFAQEISGADSFLVAELFQMLGKYVKSVSDSLPILTSPGMRKAIGAAEHEKQWDYLLDIMEGAVDIIAFQDGHVSFHQLEEYQAVNVKLARKHGMEVWSNVESFDRQIIPKFQPIAWDKLRFKLNCAVRTGHDKLITYEFTPFLSPYGCYKTWTESLLARYREWCETESRS